MTIHQYVDLSYQRTQLLTTYRQLSRKQQQVLQLTAVLYEPISKAQLLSCWNRLHPIDSTYPKFTNSTFNPVFAALTAPGLIVAAPAHSYRCHPLLVEILTREAIDAETFEAMATAIAAQLPLTYLGPSKKIFFRGLSNLCGWPVGRFIGIS